MAIARAEEFPAVTRAAHKLAGAIDRLSDRELAAAAKQPIERDAIERHIRKIERQMQEWPVTRPILKPSLDRLRRAIGG